MNKFFIYFLLYALFINTYLYCGWKKQTIAPAEIGAPNGGTSIAVDKLNRPHIAYFDVTEGVAKLNYAVLTDTGWHVETVEGSLINSVGETCSIVVDTNTVPHISYYSLTDSSLKYAKKTSPTTWTIVTIDGLGGINAGKYSSIAIDKLGHIHISYYDETYKHLKYAKFDTISWSTYTVDTSTDVGMYTSIAVDNNNHPWISYYDVSTQDLKCAHWNGATWKIWYVESSANDVGMYSAIAIDRNGFPHISYYDATSKDLKYARYTGATWELSTIDSGGDTGLYTDIVVDNQNNIHISYYIATSGDLGYAYYDGNGWNLTPFIEAFIDVGKYSSIALHTSGVIISCYDATNKFLVGYIKDEIEPSQVTTLKASPGTREGNIQLSWISPGDDGTVGNIINGKFWIKFSTNSTHTWDTAPFQVVNSTNMLASSLQKYEVTGLIPSTTYYFWIKIADEVDNFSDLSNKATSWAQVDISPPAKITYFVAMPGDSEGKLKLTWIAPSEDDYDDTKPIINGKYELRYTDNPSDDWNSPAVSILIWSTSTAPGNIETTTLWGLIPGTTIYCWIRACDENNYWGQISDRKYSYVQYDITPPAAVTNLCSSPGDTEGKINLTWTCPGDDDTVGNIATAKFIINYTTSATKMPTEAEFTVVSSTSIIAGEQRNYTLTGLIGGVTYYIWIRFADERNNIANFSNKTTSWAQVDVTPPGNITDLTALPGDRRGEIKLLWTSPGDDGFSNNIVGGKFEIRYSSQNITPEKAEYTIFIPTSTIARSKQIYILRNLLPETTYYLWVKTYDERNLASNFSNTATTYAQGDTEPPAQITDLTAITSENFGGVVVLYWTATGDDEYVGNIVDGKYWIKYSTVPDATWDTMTEEIIFSTTTSPGNRESIEVKELNMFSTYYFYLKLGDEKNNFSYESNKASATPGIDLIPPNNITDLSLSLTGEESEILLSWTGTGDDGYTGNIVNGKYGIKYSTYPVGNWEFLPFNIAISTTHAAGERQQFIVKNLSSFATYYFRIWTRDEINWSSPGSNIASIYLPGGIPPAQVSDLFAQPGTNKKEIKLTWTAVGDDEISGDIIYGAYELKYSSSALPPEECEYSIIWTTNTSPGNKETFTVSGLPEGVTYYFYLRTADEARNFSTWSNRAYSWAQYDYIPPGPVKELTITRLPQGRRLALSWTNPTDEDFAGVLIVYSTISYPTAPNITKGIDVGNTNFYIHTGLTDLITYYYTLFAYDNALVTNYSVGVSALSYPSDIIPPNIVTGLSAEPLPEGNAIKLTWNEPFSEDNDVAYYEIYTSTVSYYLGEVRKISTITTCIVEDLVDGETYYFRVRAVDFAFNKGEFSNAAVGIPQDILAPSPIQKLSIFSPPEGERLYISWEPPPEKDVVGYNVYRSTFLPYHFELLISVNTTFYLDTNLTNHITYYYYITSYDEVYNESSPSNIIYSYPTDILPPNMIRNFIAKPLPEGKKISLTWHNPSTDPDWYQTIILYDTSTYPSYLNGYEIYRGTGTNFIHENLTNNLTYYYAAFSIDVYHNYSSAAYVSTYPHDILPPTQVTTLNISRISTGEKLFLMWSEAYDIELEGYKIYRSTSQTTEYVLVFSTTTCEYIDTGLVNGITYYYYITAYDSSGNEGQKSPIKGDFPWDTVPPESIKNLTSTIIVDKTEKKYGVELKWELPEDESLAGIIITYSTTSFPTSLNISSKIIIPYPTTWYFHTKLEDKNTYYYSIHLFDKGNNYSPPARNSIYIPDVFPPNRISWIKADVKYLTATLYWEKIIDEDLAGYYLYESTDNIHFSLLSQAPLVDNFYKLQRPEGTTSYYCITAVDSDNNESEMSDVISIYFALPPAKILGVKVIRENTPSNEVVISWKSVVENADGSRIEDLKGYKVYHNDKLFGNYKVVSQTPNTIYIDKDAIKLSYYYICAEDIYGHESEPSVIVDNTGKGYILSYDKNVVVELKEDNLRYLLSENNPYNADLDIAISSITPSTNNKEEKNTILAIYEIKTFAKNKTNELQSFSFPTNKNLQIPEIKFKLSPEMLASAKKTPNINNKQISLYFFNGVKYVKVHSEITYNNWLVSKTPYLGNYKLQLSPSPPLEEFYILSTYPEKIFTPNNDGINDKFIINFSNPTEEDISAYIYDLSGAEVSKMELVGTNILQWDGKNYFDEVVPAGVYIYQIKTKSKIINGTIVVAK